MTVNGDTGLKASYLPLTGQIGWSYLPLTKSSCLPLAGSFQLFSWLLSWGINSDSAVFEQIFCQNFYSSRWVFFTIVTYDLYVDVYCLCASLMCITDVISFTSVSACPLKLSFAWDLIWQGPPPFSWTRLNGLLLLNKMKWNPCGLSWNVI